MVEILSGAAGVILSAALLYVPGLKQRFEKLDGDGKRRVVAAAFILAALAVYGLSCYGLAQYVACNENGIEELAKALFLAFVGSQAGYVYLPKPSAPEG